MKLMKFLLALLPAAALGQSVPNGGTILQGEVWTPAQWMSAWASKLDVAGGTGATGTGLNVLQTSPILVTPNLGVPSYLDLTNAINAPAGSLPQCSPYTILGNNTGSNATVACDNSLNIASIAITAPGFISYNSIPLPLAYWTQGGPYVPCSGDTTGATDTPLLQAALNALVLSTNEFAVPDGGLLQLAPCDYYINASLIMPQARGWTIRGASKFGTRIWMVPDNTNIFVFTQPSPYTGTFWTIENMTLSAVNAQPNTNYQANGIYFDISGDRGASFFSFIIKNVAFGNGYSLMTEPTPLASVSQDTGSGLWQTLPQHWQAGTLVMVDPPNYFAGNYGTPPTGFTAATFYYAIAAGLSNTTVELASPIASASQNTSTGVWTTGTQSWSAGQQVITVGAYGNNGVGDPPPGFTFGNVYYVCSSGLSGTTVKLSATYPSGSCGAVIIPSSSSSAQLIPNTPIVPSVSSAIAYLQGPSPSLWDVTMEGDYLGGAGTPTGALVTLKRSPTGNPNWRLLNMSLTFPSAAATIPAIGLAELDNGLLEGLELLGGTWPIPEIDIGTSSEVILISDKSEYATLYGNVKGSNCALWRFDGDNTIAIGVHALTLSVVNQGAGNYCSFLQASGSNPATGANGQLELDGVSVQGGNSGSGTTLYAYTATNSASITRITHIQATSGSGTTGVVPNFTVSSGTGACATTSTLSAGSSTGAGSFVCTGTAGASSAVIAFPTPIGVYGISCQANDDTSGVAWGAKASSVTGVTLLGTIATTGDLVTFNCAGN